jgi:phospholipase/lecithinase/hemolysin
VLHEGFTGPVPAVARCSWEAVEPKADVCALFDALGEDAGRYFFDGMHATPEGHRLIAEAMFARLVELGWVAKRGG